MPCLILLFLQHWQSHKQIGVTISTQTLKHPHCIDSWRISVWGAGDYRQCTNRPGLHLPMKFHFQNPLGISGTTRIPWTISSAANTPQLCEQIRKTGTRHRSVLLSCFLLPLLETLSSLQEKRKRSFLCACVCFVCLFVLYKHTIRTSTQRKTHSHLHTWIVFIP